MREHDNKCVLGKVCGALGRHAPSIGPNVPLRLHWRVTMPAVLFVQVPVAVAPAAVRTHMAPPSYPPSHVTATDTHSPSTGPNVPLRRHEREIDPAWPAAQSPITASPAVACRQ